MTKMSIRGISLNVKIVGHGYPLVLMHGGPGADLYTLLAFKRLANQFTLVYYDHRCNGRSTGADVSSMTMDNLAADADALRQALGFPKWAVLGHSFGGNVALEYALRYSSNLSHLVLLDTGADTRWPQENASRVLEQRGFSPEIVQLAQRFFNGQIEPNEMFPSLMKLSKAYNPYMHPLQAIPMLPEALQTKLQPAAMIFGFSQMLKGWSVQERLGEIQVPTLVMAGVADFVYPPDAQREVAAGIPHSRIVLVDRAGHNPHDEQPVATFQALRDFFAANPPGIA